MRRLVRSALWVFFRPFAGPQHLNGTSGPSGEGNPGGFWGNG